MIRFAFYARVSTEDQQDPESSKAWQRSRAEGLVAAYGTIVAEFFDVGLSRSASWKRRPQASALLEALADPRRGFEAVVIGEHSRAFYGTQFGETFPLFSHYGVGLWVPEVGGAIDPANDAHDLQMSLFGGMSKMERNRIRIRVRSAMATQAKVEGRFLGGRPPYGYRLGDNGPHPNPSKAAIGARLRKLEPDPTTAPVVRRIFREYIGGRGFFVIAERLTSEGIPSPSGADPARNRHRQSTRGAWSKNAVRAILINPRYTGRNVWNRQRRDDVLEDVENVSLGTRSRMRWNPRDAWIWSDKRTHEAIIDDATFERAQAIMRSGARTSANAPRKTPRPYLLRSRLGCSICGRKMQGYASRHGTIMYRCRYGAEYARTAQVDHPRNVFVHEAGIVDEVDRWIDEVFGRTSDDAAVRELVRASVEDNGSASKASALRRTVAECDRKLDNYRTALAKHASDSVIEWIAQAEAERAAATAELTALGAEAAPLTDAEARELVEAYRESATRLADADPAVRAAVYEDLGIKLSYDAKTREVVGVMAPANGVRPDCVGGGI